MTTVANGTPASACSSATRSVGAPCTNRPSSARPGSAASTGRKPSTSEVRPYANVQRRARVGRRSGQRCVALPVRAAGTPAKCCPAGTAPSTHEPGPICARLPIRAPGSRVDRAPTIAPAPIRIRPMWTVSPSTQWPDRSTSGSTAAPLPSRSMPVTGGRECRSTPAASFTPSARAYHASQTPARFVAPLNSASFSATHSRMWTVPPRG